MLKVTRVLLASHGTAGAGAAESAALDLCADGATVYHLTVVPDFWKGMMGDDWLNNASTRADFAAHLEAQLGREIEQHQASLRTAVQARGLRIESAFMLGKPAECLARYAEKVRPELAVIGSPRPRGTPGLRSRMQVEQLLRSLRVPLLIVPHPAGA